MKTRFWKYILLLALTMLAFFLWKHRSKNTTVSDMPTGQTALQSKNTQNIITPPSSTNTTALQNPPNPTTQPQIQTTNSRLEKLKSLLESKNAPVSFYGHVVDQESNGVAGVQILMSVRQWGFGGAFDSWGNKFPKFNRVTDSAGSFSLENVNGDSLTVESVTKEGYRLSPKTLKGYGYGDVSNPHYPDPQNPEVIKMWKLGESQQLVSHHLSGIGIPVDGQSVQFDLFNGKKVSSGGQLIVRLKRDPQTLPPRGPRYDWSLELKIPNGGLVANQDEFMYQAPNGGYQEDFKFDMPKDATNWTTAINQQFYIELESGKSFGSLVVRLNTIHDTPPLGINLDMEINPNGSRDLQP